MKTSWAKEDLIIAVAVIALFLVGFGCWAYTAHAHSVKLQHAETLAYAALNAAKLVDFRYDYDGCPPKDSALNAEWERRKIDAESAFRELNDEPGQMAATALSSASTMIHNNKMRCLDRRLEWVAMLGRR